jgi:exportin-2 (importin alpha re-exporter)
VQKYREDFQSLIHGFSQEIWQMCTITNEDAKFDKIVLNALRYFKNLVLWNDMRGFFESNIATLMTNLVVPNLGLS